MKSKIIFFSLCVIGLCLISASNILAENTKKSKLPGFSQLDFDSAELEKKEKLAVSEDKGAGGELFEKRANKGKKENVETLSVVNTESQLKERKAAVKEAAKEDNQKEE